MKDALRIWVDRASVALFGCRSLQRLLVSHEVLLDATVDPRPVDAAEQVQLTPYITASNATRGIWPQINLCFQIA